jgi:cytochrome c2
MRTSRLLLAGGLLSAAFLSAACGAVATPEWAAEAQETRVAQLSTSEHLTAIAPTATFTASPVPTNTPTPLPPTATPVPPTATEPPATATPIPPTDAPAAPADPVADAVAVAVAVGDPAAGQLAFVAQHSLPDGSAWACSSCHSVTPDEVRLIGPGLWNIVVRAANERDPAQAPVEYIRNSILHPQDYIAPPREGEPGWALNMPAGWDVALGEQELNDIIAYLVTLRSE